MQYSWTYYRSADLKKIQLFYNSPQISFEIVQRHPNIIGEICVSNKLHITDVFVQPVYKREQCFLVLSRNVSHKFV